MRIRALRVSIITSNIGFSAFTTSFSKWQKNGSDFDAITVHCWMLIMNTRHCIGITRLFWFDALNYSSPRTIGTISSNGSTWENAHCIHSRLFPPCWTSLSHRPFVSTSVMILWRWFFFSFLLRLLFPLHNHNTCTKNDQIEKFNIANGHFVFIFKNLGASEQDSMFACVDVCLPLK